jgi:hypothetical protein
VQFGNPSVPWGSRGAKRWFNPQVFGRPAKGTVGTAAKDVFRGPGLNNWDFALMKDIPLKSESRYFQLRLDLYNAFNHTQFSAVDNTARFDPAGNQVNAQFGQTTLARPSRVSQLTLRLQF